MVIRAMAMPEIVQMMVVSVKEAIKKPAI